MRARTALPIAALGAAAVGAAGAAAALRDDQRRNRVQRQARVWRLSARRAAHLGVTRARMAAARDDEARKRIDDAFAIKTAEDVAGVLGEMKGVIMKAGQMLSFLADGLPPEAQAALATLQADVPPMAPSLAEQVVREELGDDPERLFLEWDPVPVAAASIGQVHRAVLRDGRIVAVKVQYPGVRKAIEGDLDNAEQLYGLFAAFALKNLDVKGLVDELRARMKDELDYRHEAACQQEFADRYAGHPFVRIPSVVPERSAGRVLTSEWVDGRRWDDFLATADAATKQRAGEVLMRFSQGAIHRFGVFNGDPHPGNYRFHDDGTVTFLDFGLVKRWGHGEFEELTPILDGIMANDAASVHRCAVEAGFLSDGSSLAPERLFEYVAEPYRPFTVDEFTYSKQWVAQALGKVIDITGEFGDVISHLNMPPSYVILDRVVWGVSGLLGRLEATGRWRDLLREYLHDAPPSTELGEAEARWRAGAAR